MGREMLRLAGMSEFLPLAHAAAALEGDVLVVRLAGNWRITARHPSWSDAVRNQKPKKVILQGGEVGAWDSSLALYIREAQL